MPQKVTLAEFIAMNGTNKSWLSRRLGVSRKQLYAYLDPIAYPKVRVTDETIHSIASFLNQKPDAIRNEMYRRAA